MLYLPTSRIPVLKYHLIQTTGNLMPRETTKRPILLSLLLVALWYLLA
jgi:hypothetical protein